MKQKLFKLIISGTAAVFFIVLITFPEQSSKFTNISVSQLQEWAIYDAKPVSNRIKLNESERCEEPPLDPFDKSITSYVSRTAPLKCNRVYPDAVKFVESEQMLVLEKVNTLFFSDISSLTNFFLSELFFFFSILYTCLNYF